MAGHGEKNRIHSAALNGNGIGTATFDILGTRKREGSVLHATEMKKNPSYHKANVLVVKFKLFSYRHRNNDQRQNQWKLDSSSTHPKIPHSKETRQRLECNHLMYSLQQLAMLRTMTRHLIMYTMATALQTHPYTPMRTSSAKCCGNQRRRVSPKPREKASQVLSAHPPGSS